MPFEFSGRSTARPVAMLAPQGIRVTGVSPGSIEFPGSTWERRRLASDLLQDKVLSRKCRAAPKFSCDPAGGRDGQRPDLAGLSSILFGRMGTPDEIAEVALFLASYHARWVTSQTLAMDGGQLLGR